MLILNLSPALHKNTPRDQYLRSSTEVGQESREAREEEGRQSSRMPWVQAGAHRSLFLMSSLSKLSWVCQGNETSSNRANLSVRSC